MGEKYKFDYYYGSQADQFSFFRLPKLLIRDKRFKDVSSDAKILYGILLDRMSLSMKNRWMDDENRCKSQYKNAQKSEYKNVQGSDIYSSGCASKKDRFSLRRYDGPLIETISE